MRIMLKKVISGGQTGVDRAGLDAAINAGFLRNCRANGIIMFR
jgi:hypothetical protein